MLCSRITLRSLCIRVRRSARDIRSAASIVLAIWSAENGFTSNAEVSSRAAPVKLLSTRTPSWPDGGSKYIAHFVSAVVWVMLPLGIVAQEHAGAACDAGNRDAPGL